MAGGADPARGVDRGDLLQTETYVAEHPMAAGSVWRDEFGHPTQPGDNEDLDLDGGGLDKTPRQAQG